MAQITYQNAIDENGNCIHISKVEPENHRGRIFHCLSCGREMIAKIGDPNKTHSKSSHFAHKIEGDCNKETYLHKLGKMLFKKRFDSGDPIYIKYPTQQKCDRFESCPMYDKERCFKEVDERINLKDLYDRCTEEKEYGDYRADLLLESSKYPNRKPLFIEIVNTHKSTEDKKESGNRIIEIDVHDEEQIKHTISMVLREEDGVRFHNFKKKVSTKTNKNISFALDHLILYKSGGVFISQEPCRDVNYDIVKPNSDLELVFYRPPRTEERIFPLDSLEASYFLAEKEGYNIRTCKLCQYHRMDPYIRLHSDTLVCNLHEKFGTPQCPENKDAITCTYFKLNKYIDEKRQYLPYIKYRKLPLTISDSTPLA